MTKKPKVVGDDIIEYRKFGEPLTFVLNNLSEDMATELNEAIIDHAVIAHMRDMAAREGFTGSWKFQSTFKRWQYVLACNGKGFLNTGLAVSGASSDSVTDAEFVALFKLYSVAGGDLTTIAPSGNKFKRG